MKFSIKILGTGCTKCELLAKYTTEVVNESGFDAEINKISNIEEILKYRIISTPGLVINGKVVSSGRLPSKTEIKKFIIEAQSE